MNRNDFRRLSRVRLREARALLEANCFHGAYYLSGYAVECALKACIAKRTNRHDFPDRTAVNNSYSHDLARLVLVAGLTTFLEAERLQPEFELNWTTAKDWTEESRYQLLSKKEAQDMYKAIASRKHGVLRWIRRHW